MTLAWRDPPQWNSAGVHESGWIDFGDLRLTNQWTIVSETSILLSYTPMMSAFYGLKRTFSGLTLEFSGWKQGGFLPHHTWSISPIGWFLSWVSSRLAARWISLDLNADHYPTATGLQWGGMLMIDGWRLQNFMTAIDIVWRSGYKLSHDTGLPTLTNFRNGATGAFVGRLVSKKMSFNETFWWSNVINMMGNICQQLNHVWLSLSLSIYIIIYIYLYYIKNIIIYNIF